MKLTFVKTAIALFAAMSLSPSAFAQTAPYPDKPLSIVVHSGAGSGTDLFARAIAEILKNDQIVSVPITIENRTGGSGAVAINYLISQKGNADTLWMTTSSVVLAQPRRAKIDVNYTDFTPIALLAADPIVVAVRTDAPYATLDDLVAAAKAEPKKVRAGISAIGGGGHIGLGILSSATGVEFSYVPFASGGEAAAALLGGHVDVVMENPGEMLSLLEAKRLRSLAVTTSERLPDLAETPTLKELGVDVDYEIGRAIFMPGDVPADVKAFWQDAFKRLVETEAWQKFVKENQLISKYRTGEVYDEYLASQQGALLGALEKLGVLKD